MKLDGSGTVERFAQEHHADILQVTTAIMSGHPWVFPIATDLSCYLPATGKMQRQQQR